MTARTLAHLTLPIWATALFVAYLHALAALPGTFLGLVLAYVSLVVPLAVVVGRVVGGRS